MRNGPHHERKPQRHSGAEKTNPFCPPCISGSALGVMPAGRISAGPRGDAPSRCRAGSVGWRVRQSYKYRAEVNRARGLPRTRRSPTFPVVGSMLERWLCEREERIRPAESVDQRFMEQAMDRISITRDQFCGRAMIVAVAEPCGQARVQCSGRARIKGLPMSRIAPGATRS